MSYRQHLRSESNPLQSSSIAVEEILVSGVGSAVGVLPEGGVAPPCRERSDGAGIASDPQRVGAAERCVVARAGRPPVGGGVDDGILARLGMVGVREVTDPRNHSGCRESVAGCSVWVVWKKVQYFGFESMRFHLHSISRAPGRVIPSALQPPPWARK